MLPWVWASERLASTGNYWVVTARPDGRPHAVPVWGVWLDETFYFGTDRESRKARNLAAGSGLVVHLESGDEVVILEGAAEKVTEASRLDRFADAYEAKYGFRPDTTGAVVVTYVLRPRAAYGWLERDFVKSATRFEEEGRSKRRTRP